MVSDGWTGLQSSACDHYQPRVLDKLGSVQSAQGTASGASKQHSWACLFELPALFLKASQ